ncbi:MAG: DUF6588 family protein [Bdellovibrionota bacterium]
MRIRVLVLAILSALFSFSMANAADISFGNISESEFKDIIEEFGAGYSHVAVSGASSLGTIFGFEVGLIAGGSKSDSIDKLSKEIDASSEFDTLPHAALFGAVTFPFGITGEINFLPEIKNSDVEFKTGSFAVKWTPTDLWEMPVEMAVKLHAASSEVSWSQTISSQNASVDYEQSVTGLLFQVSKKFVVLEPYFNIGSVKAKGKLSSSQGSVFDPSYTSSGSSEEEVTGMMVQAGLNLNLLFFRLGAEVGKVLDNEKASLKASFYF